MSAEENEKLKIVNAFLSSGPYINPYEKEKSRELIDAILNDNTVNRNFIMDNIHEYKQLVCAFDEKQAAEKYLLTALDKACVSMIIKDVWLYKGVPDSEMMKLKLIELLKYYPQLTGRMNEADSIDFTNEGIKFKLLKNTDIKLKDIEEMSHKKITEKYTEAIAPKKLKKGKDAPLSVQITQLQDGFVLGVQCWHACMDADGLYTFMDNWGKICRNENISIPDNDNKVLRSIPLLSKEETENIVQQKGWHKISFSFILQMIIPKITGFFNSRIPPVKVLLNDVEKQKQIIEEATNCRCSTHEVLAAWIIKKYFDKNVQLFNDDKKCSYVTVINLRNRLQNVPKNYPGNAIVTPEVAQFNGTETFEKIAETLHHAMQQYKTHEALNNFLNAYVNAITHKLPYLQFNAMGMMSKKPTVMYVNNLSKVPVYDVDFGEGKPIKVIPHQLGDTVLLWPLSATEEAVEVYFSGALAKVFKDGKL